VTSHCLRESCEGVSALAAFIPFESPLAAAALGLLLGGVSTLVSLRASRLVTPEDPTRGFALVIGLMGLRLLVTLIALAAYFFFARPGFAAFAAAVVVSFIGCLALEAVKLSRTPSNQEGGR
jgi:hypothetical protein